MVWGRGTLPAPYGSNRDTQYGSHVHSQEGQGDRKPPATTELDLAYREAPRVGLEPTTLRLTGRGGGIGSRCDGHFEPYKVMACSLRSAESVTKL